MKPIVLLLLSALVVPAGATNIDGLTTHLQDNSAKYESFNKKNKKFLKKVGFKDEEVERKGTEPKEEEETTDPAEQKAKKKKYERIQVGSSENDKMALYGKPKGSAGAAGLSGLKAARQAASMGGSISGVDNYHGSVKAFDPDTGDQVASAEDADKVEDMYRSIIDHIVMKLEHSSIAEPAFRAILWGAAALDLREVRGEKWETGMILETKAIWDGHLKAVRSARESLMENGEIKADLDHMPIIIYKPQDEVGATATWSGGIITVGDQYGGLGSSGKLAVLFHEDQHHFDSQTQGGLHDNHYTSLLPEPDDTPSGKNWTETLAYRNMGDFTDVISRGWPRIKGGKKLKDKVASSF